MIYDSKKEGKPHAFILVFCWLCASLLLDVLKLLPSSLPFCLENVSHSFQAGLLTAHSLSVPSTENIWISLQLSWRVFSLSVGFGVDRSFLSAPETHCVPSDLIAPDEKSLAIQTFAHQVRCCFPLFPIFFFMFTSRSLIMMHLGLGFFRFFLFEILSASRICRFTCFSSLGSFQPLFLYHLSASPFLLSSVDKVTWIFDFCHNKSYKVPGGLFVSL